MIELRNKAAIFIKNQSQIIKEERFKAKVCLNHNKTWASNKINSTNLSQNRIIDSIQTP